jgi:hypothetical protein
MGHAVVLDVNGLTVLFAMLGLLPFQKGLKATNTKRQTQRQRTKTNTTTNTKTERKVGV